MCASARGVKWSSLRSSGLLIAAFTKKSLRNRCAFLSQNAGHDLAAVIQVRIIATVIVLSIGFVFQTALFEILIRAKNETLTRWRAAVLSLIGRMTSTRPTQVYEIRPRRDKQGVDLISDALLFGRLWYGEPNAISNAIGYAKFFSLSHDATICVYDEAGNVVATQEHAGDFNEP
jgi:hypothetical protein